MKKGKIRQGRTEKGEGGGFFILGKAIFLGVGSIFIYCKGLNKSISLEVSFSK